MIKLIFILGIFIFTLQAKASLVLDTKSKSFKITKSTSNSINNNYNDNINKSNSIIQTDPESEVREHELPPSASQPRKVYFDDDPDNDNLTLKNLNKNNSSTDKNVQFDDSDPKYNANSPEKTFKPEENVSSVKVPEPQPKPESFSDQVLEKINILPDTKSSEVASVQNNKNIQSSDIEEIIFKSYQDGKNVPLPQRRPKQSYYSDYTIKSNDNIAIIGKHFNASADEITLAMNLIDKKLQIGKIYRIPVLSYTAKENENMETIASKNNINLNELKAVNQGLNEIQENQIILLPILDRSKIDLNSLQDSGKQEVVSKTIFIWPISNIVNIKNEIEGGVTITASKKSDVTAIASGIIIYSGNKIKKYGNIVIIKHDNGYVSAYGKLDNISIKKNDLVISGQTIATTSDIYLYFTLKKDKKSLNPLEYLPKQ